MSGNIIRHCNRNKSYSNVSWRWSNLCPSNLVTVTNPLLCQAHRRSVSTVTRKMIRNNVWVTECLICFDASSPIMYLMIIQMLMLIVDWRGFGGRDIIPTHRRFPEGARQPRLIVLGAGRKQSTPIIHIRRCAYDNGSEIGREGWVRWVRTGSVGWPCKVMW
jgi:hypothetical protein